MELKKFFTGKSHLGITYLCRNIHFYEGTDKKYIKMKKKLTLLDKIQCHKNLGSHHSTASAYVFLFRFFLTRLEILQHPTNRLPEIYRKNHKNFKRKSHAKNVKKAQK